MIPIALPLLADAARAAVLPDWVSQGRQVAAFERDFAAADRTYGSRKEVPKFDPFRPG